MRDQHPNFTFPAPRARVARVARGFTMIEILTVIAIIAVLMSVASVGIQKMDAGQATSTALAVSEALFDEARSAAVGRGTRSRILIHNDPSEEERGRYLRYMAVAVLNQDGEWEVTSRGTTLPSGVYFDAVSSSATSDRVTGIGTYGTASIELPGENRSSTSCYYYEFNAEGLCVNGDSGETPGAAFILVGGVLTPNEDTPRMKDNNRVGFIVWRNGRSSLIRNPDQIASN